MTYAADSFDTLPGMPAWVASARPETPEDVAFRSGAALSNLDLVLHWDDVPQSLFRARLALRAAEVCVAHAGRVERAGELRDAVAFLQPDDSPGPAGEIYLSWWRAVERPLSVKTLRRALPEVEAEQIAAWLDTGQGAGGAGRPRRVCSAQGSRGSPAPSCRRTAPCRRGLGTGAWVGTCAATSGDRIEACRSKEGGRRPAAGLSSGDLCRSN